MLVKAICKLCYDRNRYRSWDKFRRRDKKTGEVYVQKDRSWERGKMACVALLDMQNKLRWIDVDGSPPECCYYLVEQLMAASEKDSESAVARAMSRCE